MMTASPSHVLLHVEAWACCKNPWQIHATDTPQKTNMDTQNDGLEKVTPF